MESINNLNLIISILVFHERTGHLCVLNHEVIFKLESLTWHLTLVDFNYFIRQTYFETNVV